MRSMQTYSNNENKICFRILFIEHQTTIDLTKSRLCEFLRKLCHKSIVIDKMIMIWKRFIHGFSCVRIQSKFTHAEDENVKRQYLNYGFCIGFYKTEFFSSSFSYLLPCTIHTFTAHFFHAFSFSSHTAMLLN